MAVNGTGGTAPIFFTSTAAQGTYSGPGGGSDTSSASPDSPDYNPANPKAATFIPSPWGCKMCRLTGEPGTPILINGTTDTSFTFGGTHGHGANSTRGLDCFNADGSLFLIGVPGTHGGTPLMLLDGSTFLIKRVKGYSAANLGFNQDFGFWHPTIPNRYIDLVGSGNNTVIRYWDPSTNSITNSNVRTIPGYNSPNSQGQARYIDNSGTRLTIRANRVSDGAEVYFGYDLSTGLKTQDFQNVQGQGAPDGGPYEGALHLGERAVPDRGPGTLGRNFGGSGVRCVEFRQPCDLRG